MKKALVSFLIGGLLFVGLSVFGQSFPTWNLIGGALSPVNLTWKIGAGTTTPIYLLDVYGNARLGTSTASSLFFRGLSNFNDLFFIDASGNASTTGEWKGAKFTPEKLNYANATSDEQYLTYEASGNAFEWTTLPSGFTYDPPWITNGSILYSSSTFSNFAFGTTTPTGFLELYAATTTNTQLTITVATDTTTYDPRIVFRTGSNPTARFAVGVDYSDSNKFKIATSTLGVNDILTIDGNGRIGLGTTTPAQILAVQATGSIPALGVYASNSTPALFVNTNGDVGIGTVTPAAKLQIVSLSTADIGGLLQTTNEGDINLRWGSTAARYGQLSWQTSPTLHATIKGTASRDLSLGAGDVNDYLWIDRTGKIGVGTTSPLFAVDVEGNINIASGNTYKIGDADAVTAASTTAWNIAYDRASSSVMAFTVTDATSTPSSKNPLILKKFERAATIYKINCIADPLGTTGDQMTIDIWEADSTGQATSSVDATIACGTAGATDDGALTNPIIDASDWIYLHMKSASGSVESLGVSIYYY